MKKTKSRYMFFFAGCVVGMFAVGFGGTAGLLILNSGLFLGFISDMILP